MRDSVFSVFLIYRGDDRPGVPGLELVVETRLVEVDEELCLNEIQEFLQLEIADGDFSEIGILDYIAGDIENVVLELPRGRTARIPASQTTTC